MIIMFILMEQVPVRAMFIKTLLPLTATASTNACGSMSSPISVGPTGTYPTLSGAGGALAALQTNRILRQ